MARIVFPDHLLQHTGGEREVELLADDFRELLLALDRRWPGIDEVLTKCAVAIDGQIYQDAFLEPLRNDSEIFFMQRIEGG
ncbi:MAG: MoaD/ThiS family protein [Gammaproteobacteria bacterium]|nr:MoaD/ThiS family protein [Gammaproteobacteria bacterium]